MCSISRNFDSVKLMEKLFHFILILNFNREVEVAQKNFGAYLFTKVYGSFVILMFAFFVLFEVRIYRTSKSKVHFNCIFFTDKFRSRITTFHIYDIILDHGIGPTWNVVLLWTMLGNGVWRNFARFIRQQLDGPDGRLQVVTIFFSIDLRQEDKNHCWWNFFK